MSSVSSHEGSDRDSSFHKSLPDGIASRYAYLRKTESLDIDASRLRDTDAWSVAATVDDQESVVSNQGITPSIISSSRLTDDERSTLGDTIDYGGVSNRSSHGSSTSIRLNQGMPLGRESLGLLETLRDFDGGPESINGDDDDKRSRSNAAEFGDDGARSAADFETSELSDDDDTHHGASMNDVNDEITAPPQPQPSFATITKSYAELMEENEMLQTQLRNLQITQKHQAEMIESFRALTGSDEILFDKTMHLTDNGHPGMEPAGMPPNSGLLYDFDHMQTPPMANTESVAQRLTRLVSDVSNFSKEVCKGDKASIELEQFLFDTLCDAYLSSLPFGTENQQLLNTAYNDQIRRFHTTLGVNFAKWYRRQTVQSLSRNVATKEYLRQQRDILTTQLEEQIPGDGQGQYNKEHWENILSLCAALSLELHGGDADVFVNQIESGVKYDEEIMIPVLDVSDVKDRCIKATVSPLFVNEEEKVLVRARVLLD